MNWVDSVLFAAESDWIGGTLAEEILIFGRESGLDKAESGDGNPRTAVGSEPEIVVCSGWDWGKMRGGVAG